MFRAMRRNERGIKNGVRRVDRVGKAERSGLDGIYSSALPRHMLRGDYLCLEEQQDVDESRGRSQDLSCECSSSHLRHESQWMGQMTFR
jgi:hypothetical protein